MSAPDVPEFVVQDLQRLDLSIDATTLTRLGAYLDLLLDENQRVNLTGIRDRDEAWRRHVIDSLTLLPGLERDEDAHQRMSIIDVGSGGGLPGIPIAIAQPDLVVTLLEATGKKARFLERCVERLTLTNTKVVNGRAETIGQTSQYRQRFDVAVCRALGSMRQLLEYTLPLVRVGGRVLALKGPSVEAELDEAGDALSTLGGSDISVFDAYPQDFGVSTVIVSVIKGASTPSQYPRLPGVPRQSPL